MSKLSEKLKTHACYYFGFVISIPIIQYIIIETLDRFPKDPHWDQMSLVEKLSEMNGQLTLMIAFLALIALIIAHYFSKIKHLFLYFLSTYLGLSMVFVFSGRIYSDPDFFVHGIIDPSRVMLIPIYLSALIVAALVFVVIFFKKMKEWI